MGHALDQRPVSGDPWRLTEDDQALVVAKPQRARLEFAVLLLFFRAHGRFPRQRAWRSLPISGSGRPAARYCRPWPGLAVIAPARTLQALPCRDQGTLRHAGGHRPRCGQPDRLVARSRRRHDARYRRSRQSARGPMPNAWDGATLGTSRPRIARSAVRAYDEQFCARIHGHLPSALRVRLDALLRPSRALYLRIGGPLNRLAARRSRTAQPEQSARGNGQRMRRLESRKSASIALCSWPKMLRMTGSRRSSPSLLRTELQASRRSRLPRVPKSYFQ